MRYIGMKGGITKCDDRFAAHYYTTELSLRTMEDYPWALTKTNPYASNHDWRCMIVCALTRSSRYVLRVGW
jgi:hypothetical protein